MKNEAMPLVTKQYDLKPDMQFGWKPKETVNGAPIPLFYDYEEFEVPIDPATKQKYKVSYYGPRIENSIEMHKRYANCNSYPFTFPPNQNVIDAITQNQKLRKRSLLHQERQKDRFIGMNPDMEHKLIVDSNFESGNLDSVV